MLREMKVYTIDAVSSNSMKSRNPYSGIHETNVAKCLDTMCLDPSCNQGGHMIVIALEGNGVRPSHMGNGYSESDTMYTLNTIEQHSVCYRKTAHPRNNEEAQGYEPTELADTLNVFDNAESRTPVIVLTELEKKRNSSPVCYQKTVGALCADDWRMINKQYVDQNKVVCYSVDCRNNCLNKELSSTLQAKPQGGWSVNVTNPILMEKHDD